jgi:hypothetical protein
MEQGRSKIVSALKAWTSSSVHEKEEKTAKTVGQPKLFLVDMERRPRRERTQTLVAATHWISTVVPRGRSLICPGRKAKGRGMRQSTSPHIKVWPDGFRGRMRRWGTHSDGGSRGPGSAEEGRVGFGHGLEVGVEVGEVDG